MAGLLYSECGYGLEVGLAFDVVVVTRRVLVDQGADALAGRFAVGTLDVDAERYDKGAVGFENPLARTLREFDGGALGLLLLGWRWRRRIPPVARDVVPDVVGSWAGTAYPTLLDIVPTMAGAGREWALWSGTPTALPGLRLRLRLWARPGRVGGPAAAADVGHWGRRSRRKGIGDHGYFAAEEGVPTAVDLRDEGVGFAKSDEGLVVVVALGHAHHFDEEVEVEVTGWLGHLGDSRFRLSIPHWTPHGGVQDRKAQGPQ